MAKSKSIPIVKEWKMKSPKLPKVQKGPMIKFALPKVRKVKFPTIKFGKV